MDLFVIFLNNYMKIFYSFFLIIILEILIFSAQDPILIRGLNNYNFGSKYYSSVTNTKSVDTEIKNYIKSVVYVNNKISKVIYGCPSEYYNSDIQENLFEYSKILLPNYSHILNEKIENVKIVNAQLLGGKYSYVDQWRMGMRIFKVSNGSNINSDMQKLWGDGIYKDRLDNKEIKNSYNSRLGNNRTNARLFTIASVVNVYNSLFANWSRIYTKEGVDINPINNLHLINPISYMNPNYPFTLSLAKLKVMNSEKFKITIENPLIVRSKLGIINSKFISNFCDSLITTNIVINNAKFFSIVIPNNPSKSYNSKLNLNVKNLQKFDLQKDLSIAQNISKEKELKGILTNYSKINTITLPLT